MKRTLIALAGVLSIGLGMASAQVMTPLRFTVNSPFYVENTQLPAGAYEILPTTETNLLQMRSLGGNAGVFFRTAEAGNQALPQRSEVMFDKFGKTMVLSSIVVAGQWDASQTMGSKVERGAREASAAPAKIAAPAGTVAGE
jgi:hypothetical protein